MKDHLQIRVNQNFKQYLPDIVDAHSEDHELYFVTFTFQDQFKPIHDDVIIEYFKAFYQKLNQQIVNNPSRCNHLKAKIILVPEKSIDNTRGNLIKTQHYHGVLMINKKLTRKFHTKCILNKKAYYEFNKTRKKYYLVERMLFNPTLTHQRIRTGLSTYSTDIQRINNSRKDVSNVCSYITKNLGHFGNNGFDACDVLYFCDTSKTYFKNYKPRKRLDIKKLFITTDDEKLSPFKRKLKMQNNSFLKSFYALYGY